MNQVLLDLARVKAAILADASPCIVSVMLDTVGEPRRVHHCFTALLRVTEGRTLAGPRPRAEALALLQTAWNMESAR